MELCAAQGVFRHGDLHQGGTALRAAWARHPGARHRRPRDHAEFDAFYLVTVYTPNAQEELARIDYRMDWENAFRAHLQKLDAQKPVVFCGDLNVAHQEIDLKNPKPNRGKAGFSDEERGKFSELLAAGFTDTFRYLYPDLTGAYSWWSYRFHAREKNAGWRIDYFCVSNRIANRIKEAKIHTEIYGSDHCPVELCLDL